MKLLLPMKATDRTIYGSCRFVQPASVSATNPERLNSKRVKRNMVIVI
jgi:hypothetical protein